MNMESISKNEVRMEIDQYNEKLKKVFPGAGDPNYVSPPIWTLDTEQLSTLWELIGPEGGLTEEQQAQVDAALVSILDPSDSGLSATVVKSIVNIFECAEEEPDAQL